MLNLTHEPVVGRYLDDLAAAIAESRDAAPGAPVSAVY